jgi:hypothetical protein
MAVTRKSAAMPKPVKSDAALARLFADLDDEEDPNTKQKRAKKHKAANPALWRRENVDTTDEAALVAALKRLPVEPHWTATPCGRISRTEVDRSAAVLSGLGTALATPPPGKYVRDDDCIGRQTRGGRIGHTKRFDDIKSLTPGPASYYSTVAPKTNTKGTDFSRAPGARVINGGYFATRRHVDRVANELPLPGSVTELPSRDTPGPGTYTNDVRCAFPLRRPHEISSVAASFLSQRIPYDASITDPAVIRDVLHVREVAEELARHRLKS